MARKSTVKSLPANRPIALDSSSSEQSPAPRLPYGPKRHIARKSMVKNAPRWHLRPDSDSGDEIRTIREPGLGQITKRPATLEPTSLSATAQPRYARNQPANIIVLSDSSDDDANVGKSEGAVSLRSKTRSHIVVHNTEPDNRQAGTDFMLDGEMNGSGGGEADAPGSEDGRPSENVMPRHATTRLVSEPAVRINDNISDSARRNPVEAPLDTNREGAALAVRQTSKRSVPYVLVSKKRRRIWPQQTDTRRHSASGPKTKGATYQDSTDTESSTSDSESDHAEDEEAEGQRQEGASVQNRTEKGQRSRRVAFEKARATISRPADRTETDKPSLEDYSTGEDSEAVSEPDFRGSSEQQERQRRHWREGNARAWVERRQLRIQQEEAERRKFRRKSTDLPAKRPDIEKGDVRDPHEAQASTLEQCKPDRKRGTSKYAQKQHVHLSRRRRETGRPLYCRWTAEESNLLLRLLEEHGRHFMMMISLHGLGGTKSKTLQ